MHIRSNTWGAADISWSTVMEQLLHSLKEDGHTVDLISTNGTKGMRYWNKEILLKDFEHERKMRSQNIGFDIDVCFTVPQNFPHRFLPTSKVKMALFDYESSIMPRRWVNFYNEVDFILPGSKYVADMVKRNGCPEEKIVTVPHGVDLSSFNAEVVPMTIQTDKKYKFLCVAEPHYRKQLEELLEVYCENFTNADDCILILKTKIFSDGDKVKAYEVDIRHVLARLKKTYGDKIPAIKVISKRYDDIAPLYTACDAFVLMTASEGFGIPYLEALACGLTVIAPRHGGQLDFLNDSNSLLCDTGTRYAKAQEQYWGMTIGATVGDPNRKHFGQLMRKAFESNVREALLPAMKSTAEQFSWKKIADKVVDIAKSTGRII